MAGNCRGRGRVTKKQLALRAQTAKITISGLVDYAELSFCFHSLG